MRRYVLLSVLLVANVARVLAGEEDGATGGRKLATTACASCHSLRLVESQRLSAAAWAKEVDKMVGWGAVVPQNQALVEYLAAEYSDMKPVPPPERSK